MATEIAASLSYEQQQKTIATSRPEDLIEATPTNIYHRRTLLHLNHLQGGVIGRYKQDLTEERLLTSAGLCIIFPGRSGLGVYHSSPESIALGEPGRPLLRVVKQ